MGRAELEGGIGSREVKGGRLEGDACGAGVEGHLPLPKAPSSTSLKNPRSVLSPLLVALRPEGPELSDFFLLFRQGSEAEMEQSRWVKPVLRVLWSPWTSHGDFNPQRTHHPAGLARDLALNRGSWVCHLLPGQGGRALWMLPGQVTSMLGPGHALNRYLAPHT